MFECKVAPAQCGLILDHLADAAIRIPALDGKGPLIPVIRPSSYFADDSEWSMPIAGQLRTYFATKLEGMIGYVKEADAPADPLMRQISYGHAMENYRTLMPTFGWIDFEAHALFGSVQREKLGGNGLCHHPYSLRVNPVLFL